MTTMGEFTLDHSEVLDSFSMQALAIEHLPSLAASCIGLSDIVSFYLSKGD